MLTAVPAKRARVASFLALAFMQADSNAQPIPELPTNPTVLSCNAYSVALHETISAIYSRTTQCMRGGTSWSSWGGDERDRRPSCVPGPPAHIRQLVSAYPTCTQEEETLCSAYEAQQQGVPDCFARAKKSSDPESKEFSAASRIVDLQKQYDTAKERINDPTKFFNDLVLPRLPSHVRARLDLFTTQINENLPPGFKADSFRSYTFSPFERNPELNQTGKGLMQEVYSFLFNASAGNDKLYSKNSIISAIQGSAAKEIKLLHSNSLAQMDRATNLMDSIISENRQLLRQTSKSSYLPQPSTPRSSTSAPISRTSRQDCSILDGPDRTDFSNRDPELFEKLTLECLGHRR